MRSCSAHLALELLKFKVESTLNAAIEKFSSVSVSFLKFCLLFTSVIANIFTALRETIKENWPIASSVIVMEFPLSGGPL